MTNKHYRKMKKLKKKKKMKNNIYQMMRNNKQFRQQLKKMFGTTGVYSFCMNTTFPKEWEILPKAERDQRQIYFMFVRLKK